MAALAGEVTLLEGLLGVELPQPNAGSVDSLSECLEQLMVRERREEWTVRSNGAVQDVYCRMDKAQGHMEAMSAEELTKTRDSLLVQVHLLQEDMSTTRNPKHTPTETETVPITSLLELDQQVRIGRVEVHVQRSLEAEQSRAAEEVNRFRQLANSLL